MNDLHSLLHDLHDEAARLSSSAASSARAFDPTPHVRGWQTAAILDPSRWRSWPAGRGAGKTRGAVYALLTAATTQERVQVYYVSTSIKRAAATIWDDLAQHNADLKLGGVPNLTLHSLRFPNGSKLIVTGVENRTMANDLRGRQRCRLWFIDEAQDWRDDLLRYFYEQVIYPRLGDVRGGVILAGTGGPPRGWWYDRTIDASWSQHTATAYDNPIAPEGEIAELIAKACKDRGCTESDPSIRREFWAEFIADTQRQIFPFDDVKNGINRADLPKGLKYVIGADYGTVDALGLVAWGYRDDLEPLFVVETVKQSGLGSSAQVEQTRAMAARYGNPAVVGDPGGGGKGLIVDLRQEHGLPVMGAEKQGKAAACITLRDGLRSGRVKVVREEAEFIAELQQPEWDPEGIGAVIKGHMPDRVDAGLYGYRLAAKVHRYQEPPPAKTRAQQDLEQLAAHQARQAAVLRRLGLS